MIESAYRILSSIKSGKNGKEQHEQVLYQKRKIYKTWNCIECEARFFYFISRCPSCNSRKIEEYIHQISSTTLNKTAFKNAIKGGD